MGREISADDHISENQFIITGTRFPPSIHQLEEVWPAILRLVPGPLQGNAVPNSPSFSPKTGGTLRKCVVYNVRWSRGVTEGVRPRYAQEKVQGKRDRPLQLSYLPTTISRAVWTLEQWMKSCEKVYTSSQHADNVVRLCSFTFDR